MTENNVTEERWLEDAIAAVKSYKDLKENWDSYGASEISHQTIYLACDLLLALYWSDWPEPATAPTPAGEIAMWWGDEASVLKVRSNEE